MALQACVSVAPVAALLPTSAPVACAMVVVVDPMVCAMVVVVEPMVLVSPWPGQCGFAVRSQILPIGEFVLRESPSPSHNDTEWWRMQIQARAEMVADTNTIIVINTDAATQSSGNALQHKT